MGQGRIVSVGRAEPKSWREPFIHNERQGSSCKDSSSERLHAAMPTQEPVDGSPGGSETVMNGGAS